MANKKYTEQEILIPRNSKYVLNVSPSIEHFLAEFKGYSLMFPVSLWNGVAAEKSIKSLNKVRSSQNDSTLFALKCSAVLNEIASSIVLSA